MTQPILADALAHHAAGRLAEAAGIYQAILSRTPDNVDAMAGLGVIALDGGQPAIAHRLLAEAARKKPGDALLHNNFANAARAIGDAAAARTSYRRAVSLAPDRVELLTNHAAAGGPGSATWAGRALAIGPGYADAWFVLAQAADSKGQLGTAVRALSSALALDPQRAECWFNRGNTLRDLGEVEVAVGHYRRALALRPDDDDAASNLLFALCFVADDAAITAANLAWGRRVETSAPQPAPFLNGRESERRLTVGYLSPDFRRHHFVKYVTPLLDHHDRERFRLVGLSDTAAPDEETERLRPRFDEWHDTGRLDDAGLDRAVRTAGIDVLVCLTGYVAAWRRRFVPKKAPVQVAAINQVSSLGLTSFDARLTDRWLEPPELGDAGPEKPIRLTGGYAVFDPPATAPALTPPPATARGYVTFGCFNNLAKITDTSLELFRRVLDATPGSRLLVKAMSLSDAEPRARFHRRLDRAGLEATRVDLVGRIQGDEANLAALAEADIALDPTPFNGGMSTVDALWMGVPVVSLKGGSLVGRVGNSMLSRAGLSSFVAEKTDSYVQIATELAADLHRLTALRNSMREQLRRSNLTDGRIFASEVEQAFRGLWRQWCRR